MFNLQGSEIIFILLIALVVLGPEKLPGAIRRVMTLYGELRKMSSGFQAEFKSVIDEPLREFKSTADLVKSAADPKRMAEEAEREAELEAAGAKKAQQARDVTAAMEAAGAAHLAQASVSSVTDTESAVGPEHDVDAFADPVDERAEGTDVGDEFNGGGVAPTVEDGVLDERPSDDSSTGVAAPAVTDDAASNIEFDADEIDADEFDADEIDDADADAGDDAVARNLSSVELEFEPEGKSA